MSLQFPTFTSGAALTSIFAHRKMNSLHLVSGLPSLKKHLNQSVLSPRLLHGETTQGFMTADFKPARATSERFSHDHQSAHQIRLLL